MRDLAVCASLPPPDYPPSEFDELVMEEYAAQARQSATARVSE